MKNKKNDFVFNCRKCGHLIFLKEIKKLLKIDCPECGEEAEENWIFSRMGNYDKEFGKDK